MAVGVQVLGVRQAHQALANFSHAVATRGQRVALSAAMGQVKNRVVANLARHQDTGLNVKSTRVKTIIPRASKNPAVRDRPAVGLVGAGKGLAAITTKRGKQKILSAKDKKSARAAGSRLRFASRYSHFPEAKHHDLARAAQQAAPAAQAAYARKMSEFAIQEAHRQASKP